MYCDKGKEGRRFEYNFGTKNVVDPKLTNASFRYKNQSACQFS
jgi:hypothetical protein